ncbi:hypothetical protein FisN_39Lh006 [Fistulifera solaris]|uniref:Uncharacterized protein n=1 Tax=Fistulifera solaris TaxID=1519565 RepID=A0A1Z5K7S1_FISSO|nr:hypothetical protein FisN_39Lh006 [Fistulifera solaris]|eukprot:GAX22141.1 hypothetical protein FisN_39Lh006 [Fistulifera solaris]
MNQGLKNTGSFLASSAEKTQALRTLFQWIEKRYGGLPFDKGPAAEIITCDKVLQTSDLKRLMQHQATAIHVKGFYDLQAAVELGKELAHEAGVRNWKVSTSRGLESSDVSTLGEHAPYNVVAASPKGIRLQAEDEYFDGVQKELQRRRTVATEHGVRHRLWPLDLLRLSLDEAWPAGAGLARESKGKKRPYSGGLPRIMKGPTRWRKGFIHVDEMGILNPQKGLFSANIYLQMPDDSRENADALTPQKILDIWPVAIRSRWDWYRNALLLSGLSSQDTEDQMRLRFCLGDPLSIAVAPGDLILICAQRPHAAVGFQSGVRVSLQCFVQHNGLDQRLLIDS